MTMLDTMRRHKSLLNWSLILVVLAFIIFYIPDFLRGSGADAASADTIASKAATSRPPSSGARIRRSCRRTAPRTART